MQTRRQSDSVHLRMQSNTVAGGEVFPNADVLAQGSVTGTWHVRQNAVKQQRLELFRLVRFRRALLPDIGWKTQAGQLCRVVVCDHHAGPWNAMERLVHEQVASLSIAVVGDQQPRGQARDPVGDAGGIRRR